MSGSNVDVVSDNSSVSEDRHGCFQIEYRSEGVVLSVYPPVGKGRAVTVEEVLQEVKEREIRNADGKVIRAAVYRMEQNVVIAEPQQEIIRDGQVKVDIDRDGMRAYLIVYPPRGGRAVTLEAAKKALEQAGVIYGIDEEKVNHALTQIQTGQRVAVAFGKPPEDGKNAKIDYKVNTDSRIRPVELEDGRVDFYNLNLIRNVQPGEILAIRTPPTEGIAGLTVLGKEIRPRAGKDMRIPAGKNTQLSEDGCILMAGTAGHVYFNGEKIQVDPVFELKGDVDFSSGNLNFLGSIVIHGSVTYGFQVNCEGNLEVRGSIDGGSVTVGGSLTVRQGIQGQQKSIITVKGDVLTRFIENATVKAGGDIVVGEGIMHSSVDAGRSITVGGRKGLIVGGRCRAGEEIHAKNVGSLHATATEIEVGIRPEKRAAYNELAKKLNDACVNLDKTEKAVNVLKEWEKRQGQLPVEKRMLLWKLTQAYSQLYKDVEALSSKKAALDAEFEQVAKGRIRVAARLYPGVNIRIGQYTTRIREPIDFTTVYIEQGEFRFTPYG
ncbi:conserved hypothetical protein [Heliomicrobium modesticaldum Ice1]|uniref:Flagellar Assembly Protein A N-terminal region domain-containing protein n=1 Tax=Heliobacterium modesticaldum (strain ATCC 51547 / Ice1) TaxID=498761 RepID=B0THD3_HELMI|nr:FapA family protein [Heliomicrobium modesticaldum]ABZ84808.1 conserved hypothetical protein [Heliomicrobium modesticaldum Ice1]